MHILALITLILGLAALVFGVVFFFQANSGNQEIADSIAPLTFDQVEPMYDQVFAQVSQMQPSTDPNYLLLSGQRTSLGLAKANIGNMKILRINGIVDVLAGLGLVLTGIVLYKKND